MNPFPEHDHDLFPIEIGIGPSKKPRTETGRANVHHKITVRAFATCCQSLFVHPTYPNHDIDNEVMRSGWKDWTVSHEPTGTLVMTGIPDERTAMYLAGAVSQLLWWSHPKDDTAKVPAFQRELNRLPSKVNRFIKSWGYKK